MEKAKLIRTFGRVRGKKLSARQTKLCRDILPILAPTPAKGAILEIGFGNGEHLIKLSRAHPGKTIIGAEPFINGVASLLSHITDEDNKIKSEYKNIRIWPDDVRKLFSTGSFQFSAIYILHPDPWPKARHEKRRLLSSEFLKTLGSLIHKDSSIIIGTDHTDYRDWILEQIPRSGLIVKSQNLDIIKTKYQKKNMFGSEKTMYLVLMNK